MPAVKLLRSMNILQNGFNTVKVYELLTKSVKIVQTVTVHWSESVSTLINHKLINH